ncbi:serine/threonine protein kinase [Xanthomonadaceae bacterium JHOS43]|nr:serine/threonine protein kinase [Xanthomonadaceae bacterium JHOS43]MCX7563838.1 serine/threonine protein kinase [Xanthomonadaceae bacterium XH05]
MKTSALPYERLTPDTVIDAVESLGLYCDGRILTLNSYENRVYRIGVEDAAPLVAKFYRPDRWSDAGIIEEHQFARELAEADLSVVAPLELDGTTLFRYDGFRFALFPCQGGHAPELDDDNTLRQLGRTLARMHNIGARRRFMHRPALDTERFGHEPVRYLIASNWIPVTLRTSFQRLCRTLLGRIDEAFAQLTPLSRLRLHGDCHPGNILWRDGVAHFVDLDDCLTGPAIQDLWMFLSGAPEEQRAQLDHLIEGYAEFRDFDWRECRLIEPLRGLRLLHYHAWIARRWHDPAFPRAFPWFAEIRHWEDVLRQVQEQLAAMDDQMP